MTINPHAAPLRTRYASSRPASHAQHAPRPIISLRAPRPDSVGQYTNLPPPAQLQRFAENDSVQANARHIRVKSSITKQPVTLMLDSAARTRREKAEIASRAVDRFFVV